MNRILFSLLAFYCLTGCHQAVVEQEIRTAVEQQLANYPQSTLRDLYKNFFQDDFGPGHLVPDTAVAGQYLREELETCTPSEILRYEPTGYKHKFYRVDLSIVKSGKIPYEHFFQSFIRSVQQVRPVSPEAWRKEWKCIDRVIQSMHLSLPQQEDDRWLIQEKLDNEDFVMHHSALFEQHYTPHYRIIERTIFEKEILPYFQ